MELRNLGDALTIDEKIKFVLPLKEGVDEVADELKRWKEMKSLVTKNDFIEMLRQKKLSESEFASALKDISSSNAIQNNGFVSQEWIKMYYEIIDRYKNIKSLTKDENLDIGYLIHPYILYFKEKFTELVVSDINWRMAPDSFEKIYAFYIENIVQIFNKIFVVKLHKYKTENLGLEYDEKKEFGNFIKEEFSTKEKFHTFFDTNIVCTRLAVVKTKNILNFLVEAFRNLKLKEEDISKEFLNGKKIETVDIKNMGAGDSHQQSKTVILLEVNGKKVVYKPRNLKIAIAYNSFLDWINENFKGLEMKCVNGLYFEEFAVEEFVQNVNCLNDTQIRNYYIRYGYILAISYLLRANDLHYENLIAYGEYPMLIDLETIFQSYVETNFGDSAALNVRKKYVMDSLASTALLPLVAFSDTDNSGFDISALGGGLEDSEYKKMTAININTIDMRYEKINFQIVHDALNLPKMEDKKIDFKSFKHFIIDGFENLMTFFLAKKEYLLSNDSVIDKFSDKINRTVIKNTERYQDLLSYSNHPNYCEKMKNKEKLLENLWSYPYKNKMVVLEEYEDMLINDIPIFFGKPNSTSLYSSRGREVKNFFSETGLNLVKQRILNLTNDEVELQLDVIKVNFGFYDNIVSSSKQQKKYLSTPNLNIDYEYEAKQIADKLLSNAILNKKGDEICYPSVNFENSSWQIDAMNESLYEGTSGMGLFFLECYKRFGEEEYYKAYKKLIQSSITMSKYTIHDTAFAGMLSIVFPVLCEISMFGTSIFEGNIREAFKHMRISLYNIDSIDWITGLSGILGLSIEAYYCLADPFYLEIAEQLANEILLRQNQNNFSKTGFGHGNTGVAYALVKAYELFSSEIYLDCAKKLIVDEDIMFELSTQKTSWCWGAVGTGLGRLAIKDSLPTGIGKLSEFVYSLSKDFKFDDCICHGNMGDIELLRRYMLEFSDEEVVNIFDKKIKSIFAYKISSGNFSLTELKQVKSLGLFTGISGIGYELLKISDTENQMTDVFTLSIK